MGKGKILFLLHALLMAYSFAGVFSKLASGCNFLSAKFIMCYAAMITMLGIYAIGWQQVIKRLPLTVAFANKGITVIWGIIWGVIIFQEKLNVGKIVGSVLVILGLILFVTSDAHNNADKDKDLPDE